MGCFPSKKDIEEDDKPRQRQTVPESVETKTISTPIKPSTLGDETMAKSHDEFRMLENDAFIKTLKRKEEQEIIKQTSSEMFDLSQLDYIHDDELEEKEQYYKEFHQKLNFGKPNQLSLLRFNLSTKESAAMMPLPEDNFVPIFEQIAEKLVKSYQQINIKDCGSLVCSFPPKSRQLCSSS